jgi:vitamin B12 transporter
MFTQGAENRHTLIMIDGVRLNNASGGDALTNGLPLGIIKRVEVIKGPASSSWGSSLGGVVNIITKETGRGPRPTGQATASVGEKNTSEVSAQGAGQLGPVGYYLYGGGLETDGHFRDSWFDNQPLYAKLTLPLPGLSLGATIGHTAPHYKSIEWADNDMSAYVLNRTTFSTAYLDAPLGMAFNLHLAFSRFDQSFDQEDLSLGLGTAVGDHLWEAGERLKQNLWQETNDNLSARLNWNGQQHAAVIGLESSRGDLAYSGDWRYWQENWNYPAIPYNAKEERRAAFANVALNWGRLTLTPGGRYDFSSTSDEAFSPSLGATYRVGTETILRSTIAQGFNVPNLTFLFDKRAGNPDLAPERVASVQAGVETVALASLRVAATLFHHRISDSWVQGQVWENQGKASRQGLELEVDTIPWHHLSLGVKGAVVSTDSEGQENDTMYAANLLARYDRPELLSIRLGGRYIRWSEAFRGELPKHDGFIWDLTLSREVYQSTALRAEIFGVVRNLFNNAQYWDIDYQNPGRWLEAGVTVRF